MQSTLAVFPVPVSDLFLAVGKVASRLEWSEMGSAVLGSYWRRTGLVKKRKCVSKFNGDKPAEQPRLKASWFFNMTF